MASTLVPQGLTAEQFAWLSSYVRQNVSHISDDIRVHGSRAAGTARLDSDLDIAIRVSSSKFDNLIKAFFKSPNPGSAAERTMLHAVRNGKISAGEAGLRPLRRKLIEELGMKVDISVVREGGPFDAGPWIPLR